MNKKYEIVSLGTNCLPRTILTRGEVKPSKSQGELSCPFDLVKHPIGSIIRCLKTDFEGYTDDLFFVARKRNILDFRKNGIWQKPDGTKFFHDKDCKIGDIDKLKTRITNRIGNFRQIIKSETPILFVMYIIEDGEYVNELYNELLRLCSHKKFKLAVLDFSEASVDYNKDISVLKLTKPIHNFRQNWNKKGYRNSKLGRYVETNICKFVSDIIRDNF